MNLCDGLGYVFLNLLPSSLLLSYQEIDVFQSGAQRGKCGTSSGLGRRSMVLKFYDWGAEFKVCIGKLEYCGRDNRMVSLIYGF